MSTLFRWNSRKKRPYRAINSPENVVHSCPKYLCTLAMTNIEIANRLREVLEESGVTQAKLADKLGIHRQSIHRIISQGAHKSKYFPEILKILDVDAQYILSGGNKMAYWLDDSLLLESINKNLGFDQLKNTRIVEFFIKMADDDDYFVYESKVAINQLLDAYDLMLFRSHIKNRIPTTSRVNNAVYLLFSEVSQAMIIGQYKKDNNMEFLSNSKGSYLIQSDDKIIGKAVQIMRYLENEHD